MASLNRSMIVRKRFDVQLVVELDALRLVLTVLEDVLERLVLVALQAHDDFAVHEQAAGGSCRARSAHCRTAWSRAFTVVSLRPMLRTVSIMPGIESRAPERQETSSGFVASPNLAPMICSTLLERLDDLLAQLRRILAAVGVEVGADVGGEGEAGGHGQADVGHLGEVGPLAAEQILHRVSPSACRRRRSRRT